MSSPTPTSSTLSSTNTTSDHDNSDDSHTALLADGVECPTITRVSTLQFTAADPNGLPLAGWGDNQLGGIYSEAITGLYNMPLYVQALSAST